MSEIPERVRKDLTLIPVKHMDEVLPLALEGWKEFAAKSGKISAVKPAKKPAKKTIKKAAKKTGFRKVTKKKKRK